MTKLPTAALAKAVDAVNLTHRRLACLLHESGLGEVEEGSGQHVGGEHARRGRPAIIEEVSRLLPSYLLLVPSDFLRLTSYV